MPTAAQVLARFAAELSFERLPPQVVERAKDCIIDTVGVVTFGAQFPWSGYVANYARRYGSGGPCSILGVEGARVHAPYAALANGAFAHAFEQDSVRDPGVGALVRILAPARTRLSPSSMGACRCQGTVASEAANRRRASD